MGAKSLLSINPRSQNPCQLPQENTTITYTYPFDSVRPVKPAFVLQQVRREEDSTIYQASLNSQNFLLRVTVCPCEHGEKTLIQNQEVFGVFRSTSGEVYFKRRIEFGTSRSLEEAFEEFCHRKVMSSLEVGENIGQIFRSDCQLYPTFLQYCSEMPITNYKGISSKELNRHINANDLTLKKHGFKFEKNQGVPDGKSIGYSPSFKRFIFQKGKLVLLEHTVQELIGKGMSTETQEHNINGPVSSGLLSVESNLSGQQQKMLISHDTSIKQAIRLHEAINSLDHQLNRLEHNIFVSNRHTESIIREKIEREFLRKQGKSIENLTEKYYICLVHFLERARRYKDTIEPVKLLLRLTTDKIIHVNYTEKLAILLNDEQTIGKLIKEESLSTSSAIWLNSLSRMYFDRGAGPEAIKALQKSCVVETEFENGAYLAASEVLFENGMIERAKQYLQTGVRKGYRIQGPLYINNSRLYDALGLILFHEGDSRRSLEAFEQARVPYELQHMSDNHYFNILGNEFCALDRLFEFDKGYTLYKEKIEKRVNDINRKQSPDEFIRFFSNIGCFLFNSSHYPQARAMLNNCLKYPAARNSLDNNSYVKLFTNLACLGLKEKDAKAETYFKYALDRESESFRVRTDLVSHWTSYHLHNNLALLYYKKGELGKSLREFEEVEDSLGSVEEDWQLLEPSLMHLNYNIGCVHRKSLKTDKARQYLQKASDIAKRLYGEEHMFVQMIQVDLDNMDNQRIAEASVEQNSESAANTSVAQGKLQSFASQESH